MNGSLDTWLLATTWLAIALFVVVVLLVASSRRARVLAERLTRAEACACTALELVRRYEPDACLAATLRADLGHACAELARYQGLTDAEADLARMQDEAAAMFARIDAFRHAAHDEIETLQTRIADLRRELAPLEPAKPIAPADADEPEPALAELTAANTPMTAASG